MLHPTMIGRSAGSGPHGHGSSTLHRPSPSVSLHSSAMSATASWTAGASVTTLPSSRPRICLQPASSSRRTLDLELVAFARGHDFDVLSAASGERGAAARDELIDIVVSVVLVVVERH